MAESHVRKAWAGLPHDLPFLGNEMKASSEGRVRQDSSKNIEPVTGKGVRGIAKARVTNRPIPRFFVHCSWGPIHIEYVQSEE
jgi:hypothetical protein